jgi:hypothetical protein
VLEFILKRGEINIAKEKKDQGNQYNNPTTAGEDLGSNFEDKFEQYPHNGDAQNNEKDSEKFHIKCVAVYVFRIRLTISTATPEQISV